MIKKLMNISGAQVLGKEELKHVVGGGEVYYQCEDGTSGYAGLTHEEGLPRAIFMCETHGGVRMLAGN